MVPYVASRLGGEPAVGPGTIGRCVGAICGLMGAAVVVLFRHENVHHVRNEEIGPVIACLVGGAVVALGMRRRVSMAG
jgi:hypothetical protein